MGQAPVDETVSIADLTLDPYPIYKRYRAQSPVVEVPSAGRILLTKAQDTKYVKDNPVLFSSDDPSTPMRRAFQYHTLMRKDGTAHMRERNSMMAAFSPSNIRDVWLPIYRDIAADYIGKLPRGEVIDLHNELSAPLSARCLAHLIGLTHASDDDLCRWSQTLIDGAGNFGWRDEPFEKSDAANIEINKCIGEVISENRSEIRPNAISAMLHFEEDMTIEEVQSNIKIVIGGGINEPRDALSTALFGLLSNPEQHAAVLSDGKLWNATFEETVRWVAPIQASSRRVTEDTRIRGVDIPEGKIVMTIQASANHDEELYEEGHLFNIFREPARNQAFGNGPHFCMGTHIARRMVGEIVLPMLFERFPKMSLPEPDKVQFWGFGFRGPLSLPVRLN
ncbi:MAG: cytochrome P450 [Anderseniella sp.]